MFKGIKLRTLLSTPEEWHALVIGFFEVLCPWPARIKLLTNDNSYLNQEYHYYTTGRGLGFIALLLILTGLAKLFKEAML